MTAPKIIAKEIIRALAFDKMIQRGLEDVKNRRTNISYLS